MKAKIGMALNTGEDGAKGPGQAVLGSGAPQKHFFGIEKTVKM